MRNMKNFASITVLSAALLAVLGCGMAERIQQEVSKTDNTNSNKTITDKAVETTVGESTTGVPECDEVMDLLASYANNPDDNFVVKAGKQMLVNKVRDTLKASIEENKTDKVQLAKDCKEAKTELEKSLAGEANKNSY